ncbi:uncharacterized protein [Magallana gigas]|uniref:RING-type domain-containing protein n=1 Tax=Magallana gigas TaxID=29159 RepID=A0A8W8NJ70_MAGGI|nr:uncharacterized protein LOC105333443 [Crassostrea gigas]
MECSGKLLCSFLCLELAALLMFVFCLILHALNGGTFSVSDVVFISSVLTICLFIMTITICLCLAPTCRPAVTLKLSNRRKPIDSEDVITRKLTVLHDTLDHDCPICLTTTQNLTVQLSCKHEYHESCIREWFERSGNFRCPGCRQECLDQTKRTPDVSSVVQTIKKDDISTFPLIENV